MQKKDKDKNYFNSEVEEVFKKYLTSTNEREKNKLFEEVIDPILRKLVKGVMTMPMFQKIIGISREVLEEDCYYHVFFNLHKFNPETVGKTGELAKAYSYYGTIARNYILQIKQTLDKQISKQGGMVDI